MKFNGRVFEALESAFARRRPRDLYHSALEVNTAEGRFVIEITPIPDSRGRSRGVISEGAVGSRLAVPMKVWGRDELRAGEVWNSNSVIAWLLVKAGIEIEAVDPPEGGRAPGWDAGVRVANRR